MANIPKDKKWQGMSPGKYFGNLWQTWNIDLERYPGRLFLSNNMQSISAASEGLGVVDKFIRTNASSTDEWWGLTTGKLINNGNPVITAGTWANDDTTGFAGVDTPLDMEIHESVNNKQRLFVAMNDDIAVLNTTATDGTWDVNWGSTIPSTPIPTVSPVLTHRPMAKLQRLLAIANKVSGIPKIDTIDKDDTVTLGAIQFGAEYTVRLAMASSDRFWFALQHDADGDAKIIEWDGFSTTYNYEYDLKGSTPLTGFLVNNIPYYITEKGWIFRFTGGGFVRVQNFNTDEEQTTFGTSLTAEATIKPYGSWADEDIVYLNVGAPMRQESGANTLLGARRARSGIWIFNTKTGNLYQHRGLGERLNGGIRNFGNPIIDSPGAVIKANTGSSQILVASAGIYTGGATWVTGTEQVLYRDAIPTTTSLNRGYIITPYIPIDEVEETFEALWVKFKRFVDSGNRIIVKWRVREPLVQQDSVGTNNEIFTPLQASGTWVNTTSFTCAVPTGVAVDDEVEVLSGDNAGCSFNISGLSATPDGSTTITVTIDEATPISSTDTAVFRFDNWRTETAISSTTIGNQKVPFTVSTTSGAGNLHGEFIQLKIELRGLEVQLDEIIPVSKNITNKKQA